MNVVGHFQYAKGGDHLNYTAITDAFGKGIAFHHNGHDFRVGEWEPAQFWLFRLTKNSWVSVRPLTDADADYRAMYYKAWPDQERK